MIHRIPDKVCPECNQSLEKVEVTTTVCFECLEKDKIIQAQAALIRKLGEPLKKIANETGQMPDEQEERDEIAEAIFEFDVWLNNGGKNETQK